MYMSEEELQRGMINDKSPRLLLACTFQICSLGNMGCLLVQHVLEHSQDFFQGHVPVPAAGKKTEQKIEI